MKKLAVLALVASMSAASFAAKIGVVNTQEVFAKYSGTKKIEKQLVQEKKSLEDQIRGKEVNLQKFGVELQGKGDKVTDSDKASYKKQAKALNQFVKESQMKLSRKEREGFDSIKTNIDASVQTIAREKKYDYVFEAGAVKYGGTDITQDVINLMESGKKVSL